MDSLIRLFRLPPLSRPIEQKRQERPIALQNSLLRRLPLDILLLILDMLPEDPRPFFTNHLQSHSLAVSASTFTLSCMQLKQLIGDRYLAKLHDTESHRKSRDREELLRLMARDYPNKIACDVCLKLHDRRELEDWIKNPIGDPFPECKPKYGGNLEEEEIGPHFNHTVFRLAMKRHVQNPKDSRFLKLLCRKPFTGFNVSQSWSSETTPITYIQQTKETCRISQGKMVQRVQSVFLFDKSTKKMPQIKICAHLDLTINDQGTGNLALVATCWEMYYLTRDAAYTKEDWSIPWSNNGRNLHNLTSGFRRCHCCYTDYHIAFQRSPLHGTLMFLTRWKNMGDDPESEEWGQFTVDNDIDPVFPGEDPVGQIIPLFERVEDFRFDEVWTLGTRLKLSFLLWWGPSWKPRLVMGYRASVDRVWKWLKKVRIRSLRFWGFQ